MKKITFVLGVVLLGASLLSAAAPQDKKKTGTTDKPAAAQTAKPAAKTAAKPAAKDAAQTAKPAQPAAKPAARRPVPETPFSLGGRYLTPQVGINTWAVPFGASFELGLTKNVGVGGTVMMWFWSSQSVIVPEADVMYHFTSLNVDKLDLFAGAGLGYAIYHSSFAGTLGSGIYLDPFVAGRYWVSPKVALSLRLNFGVVGDWTGVGGQLGATFHL